MSIALSDTIFKTRDQFVANTLDVGRHFGFTYLPHTLATGTKVTLQAGPVATLFSHEDALRQPATWLAERHAFVRTTQCLGYHVHTHTIGSGKHAHKETTVSFHIAGTRRPVAEATAIMLARTALKEAGITNTTVHINPLGNHESNNRYNKELATYLKKVLPSTPALIEEIHERPRRVLARLVQECAPCIDAAPAPMDFLNDEAREHLKQLLEYLEAADVPYTIDPTVIGSHEVWEYTLFDIRVEGNDEQIRESAAGEHVCIQPRILALGGRYSPFIRKAYKHGLDTVAVLLTIDGPVEVKKSHLEAPLPKTQLFFGHVSEAAKKVALGVLASLRDAGIAVQHAVTRDTLTHQLTAAQAPTYMIMIGHKEALSGTCIVRNELTRAQKEVPLTELATHLKRIAK